MRFLIISSVTGDLTHLVEVDNLKSGVGEKRQGACAISNNGMTDRLLSWLENLFFAKFSTDSNFYVDDLFTNLISSIHERANLCFCKRNWRN